MLTFKKINLLVDVFYKFLDLNGDHLTVIWYMYSFSSGTSVVASTSCYLLCGNQWYVLAKMQTPRCRHGLAVTGEFVYAVGGQYREG